MYLSTLAQLQRSSCPSASGSCATRLYSSTIFDRQLKYYMYADSKVQVLGPLNRGHPPNGGCNLMLWALLVVFIYLSIIYYVSLVGSASYRITGDPITMLCRSNTGKIAYMYKYINKTNCAQNISSNLPVCNIRKM